MNKSEQINELATALAKAQGEIENGRHPEIESAPLVGLVNVMRPMRRFMGRRRDDETPIERFLKSVVFGASECWHWRKLRPLGYGSCDMFGERLAHRVSWRIHNGDIPEGMYVLHRCDVRNCVNPDHLFLGTKADNHRDMVQKGRNPRGYKRPNHKMRGEIHHSAKLTQAEVDHIRQKLKEGETGASLARAFGVTRGMIYHIAHGRAWAGAAS